MIKKSILFLVFILSTFIAKAANNSISDTLDVLNYAINLDITDFTNKTISGNTQIIYQSKISTNIIVLDLRSLNTDSIFLNGIPVNYTTNASKINIQLASNSNVNDIDTLTVFYHGTPYADASWGGFTFNGVYAFNMGVGFTTVPHNLGGAWFPCVDNFVERANFDFKITTPSAYKAFCNGILINHTLNTNLTETWHWHFTEGIATYLAGVAVAPYVTLTDTFQSIAGISIPVNIGALAADTLNCKNYFQKLHQTFDLFESKFGPYPFEKVGYVVVPFNFGAMEHASNIAIGKPFIVGNTYESIYPHELSHMWFGDLITCESAADMWLNEGWASYCEQIFYENLYSRNKYDAEVKANHFNVISKAHTNDGGYFAVAGVPNNITYGSTVYNKGSDMIHTLRTYMGDANFFTALSKYFSNHKWKSINTNQFRDSLIAYSGNNNLNNFFADWVATPGFPHFQLQHYFVDGINLIVEIFVNHSVVNHYDHQIPVTLSLFKNDFSKIETTVFLDYGCNRIALPKSYNTDLACIIADYDNKLSEAITEDHFIINSTGLKTFTNGLLKITVDNIVDSVLLSVAHHWIRPELSRNPIQGLHMTNHYWDINGIINNSFKAHCNFIYSNAASNYFLDKNFITNSEDSIVLLYRPSAAHDWQIVPNAILNMQGSNTNQIGLIALDSIALGQYTFGIFEYNWQDTSNLLFQNNHCDIELINNKLIEKKTLVIMPNPSSSSISIQSDFLFDKIIISDTQGKEIVNKSISVGQQYNLPIHKLSSGVYFIHVSYKNQLIADSKFIKQ